MKTDQKAQKIWKTESVKKGNSKKQLIQMTFRKTKKIKSSNQVLLNHLLKTTILHFFKTKDSQDRKKEKIEFIFNFASNN